MNNIEIIDNFLDSSSFEELKNIRGFFGETFNKQISVLGFNRLTKKVV